MEKKSNDFNSNNYTCFGCGEQGHIKADCPNKERKEKKTSYKEKKGKSKRAYIAWDANEVSSSISSSSEEEKTNICLIAEGDDESCNSSDVSSCASLNVENYSELFEAFQETHDEANKLVLSNNRLKELNSWLEKRVKALEEELEKSKSDFENLETHCKNSLASVTLSFVKIVKILKRKCIILLVLWISFQKENPFLRMSWHLKTVFLEELD